MTIPFNKLTWFLIKKNQETAFQKPCDEKPFIICELCNYKSNSEIVYKTHIASDHEQKDNQFYACKICDKNSRTIPELIKHLKSHYKCHICNERFDSRNSTNRARDLKKHLILSHNPNPKPLTSFDCLKCGKSFAFKSYFSRHVCNQK